MKKPHPQSWDRTPSENQPLLPRHTLTIQHLIGRMISSDGNLGLSKPVLFNNYGPFITRSTQEGVFIETALPIVDSVLDGYNGTIFAYVCHYA